VTDGPVLQRGIAAARCRSCQAPIVFAVHGTTGKPHPFQVDDAGVWVIEAGTARHVGRLPAAPAQLDLLTPAPAPSTVPRYTSHFERCPQAQDWRRR